MITRLANIQIRKFVNENFKTVNNFVQIVLGKDLSVYFSYNTVVAFKTPQTGLIISENAWGTTTGKHINLISRNKKDRLPREEFEELLNTTILNIDIKH